MKWINPLKNYFSLFGPFGLRKIFSSKFEVVVGGVCEKSHLNQKCRKFHEMDKSTKNYFSLFGPFGLRKFSHQSLMWWWLEQGVCEKSHLNQKCRKFHEMNKSTKKIIFHCLAHLDLENFSSKFEVLVGGGGVCEESHLNQKCRKFHEMDKSTKKIIFHCLAHLDLEKFSHQSLRCWWWGGVCEKSHLNQKCRKFHEMDKSTKNFFSLFGPFGHRKIFSSKFEVVVVRAGCV